MLTKYERVLKILTNKLERLLDSHGKGCYIGEAYASCKDQAELEHLNELVKLCHKIKSMEDLIATATFNGVGGR